MRTLALFISFSLSYSCIGQEMKWIEFEKTLKIYISNPTHNNSIQVYNLLPIKSSGGDYPSKNISDSISSTAVKLENLIIQGNKDAVRIGFKLFTIADGEFAEWLDWTLGKLIISNPILFLKELKNHRQIAYD